MDAEGLHEADLNYWLARVLGEPPHTLQIQDGKCIRSDGTAVDYVNDPSILELFRTEGLFDKNSNDIVTNNGHANPAERFTAEIRRSEGTTSKGSGPTPVVAICRAVIAFVHRSRATT